MCYIPAHSFLEVHSIPIGRPDLSEVSKFVWRAAVARAVTPTVHSACPRTVANGLSGSQPRSGSVPVICTISRHHFLKHYLYGYWVGQMLSLRDSSVCLYVCHSISCSLRNPFDGCHAGTDGQTARYADICPNSGAADVFVRCRQTIKNF